jgi:hypothetical protein
MLDPTEVFPWNRGTGSILACTINIEVITEIGLESINLFVLFTVRAEKATLHTRYKYVKYTTVIDAQVLIAF